jgi:nucleoid-associated protein YgaU
MVRQLGRLPSAGLLVVGMTIAAGCGGGGPQFAEVEGSVTQGGKPLTNVRVEFWPESNGPKSTGLTDDGGRYVLKSEDGKRAGAMVGSHKVVVKDMQIFGEKFLGRKAENVSDLSGGKKRRFGNQYEEAARTPISKSVGAGQKNTIDIEVK